MVARSQPVATLVAALVIAAMCATVLLTTGRTVGNQRAVLATLDDAGTRSIVVSADSGAGLDAGVLERIARIEGVEWAAALGPAIDVRNAAFAGGEKVAMRIIWCADLQDVGIAHDPGLPREVWASTRAQQLLGIAGGGAVVTPDGVDYSIVGDLTLPDHLAMLEPAILSPAPPGDRSEVDTVVVIASTPSSISPVSRAVQSVLGVADPSKVHVSTSERLAKLRALIDGQLGAFGNGLVALVITATILLVGGILLGLVAMRRREFGRRRALGATRGYVVALLMVQVLVTALLGAAIGTAVGLGGLAAGNDPLPGPDFVVALAVLAIAVALAAAILPALVAANRDPIHELRVP